MKIKDLRLTKKLPKRLRYLGIRLSKFSATCKNHKAMVSYRLRLLIREGVWKYRKELYWLDRER